MRRYSWSGLKEMMVIKFQFEMYFRLFPFNEVVTDIHMTAVFLTIM